MAAWSPICNYDPARYVSCSSILVFTVAWFACRGVPEVEVILRGLAGLVGRVQDHSC